jgi:hypothetical protein
MGMLFSAGGVGIFQWLTGLREGLWLFSFSSRNFGEDLEPNQVEARWAPFRSMELGSRRRKSVRAPPCMGIGPEMPVMAPSAVRPRL